jgi:hypothetical protein
VPAQVTGALTNVEKGVLAPVALDEVSTKIVAAIDLIASLIPDLRTPHPLTEKKVRGGRTVPREAVLAVIAMVESSGVIRSMNLCEGLISLSPSPDIEITASDIGIVRV